MTEPHSAISNNQTKMTSSKIDFSFNRIRRLTDLADLAEMLFPNNRNQQHAFLVIWISLNRRIVESGQSFRAVKRRNST